MGEEGGQYYGWQIFEVGRLADCHPARRVNVPRQNCADDQCNVAFELKIGSMAPTRVIDCRTRVVVSVPHHRGKQYEDI